MSKRNHGKPRAPRAMFVAQAQKQIQRLWAENKALKEDPNGVIAPFLDELNKVSTQNARLSALACACIAEHGADGKLSVKRETLESFGKKRMVVNILPVQEKDEMVTFAYTVESIKEEEETGPTGVNGGDVGCQEPQGPEVVDIVPSAILPEQTISTDNYPF